jgi:hypothetical protein
MAQHLADVSGETLLEYSYQKVLPRLKELEPQEFVQGNVDVVAAALTAIGALPQIIQLKDRMEKETPEVSLENVEWLKDYALAVIYSQTEYATACRPLDDLCALLDEATDLRKNLRADAMALVERGFINAEALRDYKGLNGYRNVGVDLQILSTVMRKNWANIQGKCATDVAELEHAEKVAMRMMSVVAIRQQSPARVAAATEMRARAFTLFSRAYDQVRRTVIFLRWDEDDADAFAPSLYAGRGGRGKPAEAKPRAGMPTGPEVPAETPSPPGAMASSDLAAKPAKAAASSQPFLED